MEEGQLAERLRDGNAGTLLEERGWLVLDNFLDEESATAILAEARRLCKARDRPKGSATYNQHSFKFGGSVLTKPHIYELDLHTECSGMPAAFADLRDNIAPAVQAAFQLCAPFLKLDGSVPATKMQFNAGHGGSFPLHYDNSGSPNRRSLTCVFYLNPDWKEGDGGEMVLHPFGEKEKIIVAPRMRRTVVFRSDLIVHRVLPSNAERHCFSIWFDGTDTNTKDKQQLTREHLQFSSWENAISFFASSPLQRVISRAIYREDYEQSLVESLDKEQAALARGDHARQVQAVLQKLRPLIENIRERVLPCQEKRI